MNQSNLGVALTRCYFCGEGDKIVLNTRLTPSHAAKVESMNNMVIDMEPCQKCAALMKQGVIFLTIDNSKSTPGWNRESIPNPYQTGGFFVLKDEAVQRMLDGEMAAFALKHRFMFIEHEAAEMIGLFEHAKRNDSPRAD